MTPEFFCRDIAIRSVTLGKPTGYFSIQNFLSTEITHVAILVLCTIFSLPLLAQETEELSLHDAVIGAYGEFRPQTLQNFQWLPEGAGYSYMTGAGDAARLVVKNVDNRSHQEVTLSALNSSIQPTGFLPMRFFPSVEWLSNTEIVFDYFNKIFAYNIESGLTRFILTYDDHAEFASFDKNQSSIAYVSGNNLHVLFSDSSIVEVTSHQNEDIVAGKPIHRFEFGITKGTFWSPDGRLLAFYESDNSEVENISVTDYRHQQPLTREVKYPRPGMPAEKPRVGVFNTQTKTTLYLESLGEEELYISNLTWSDDGASVFLVELNRAQRELKLVQYDAQTGKRKAVLLTESHEKYIEPLHPPVFFPDPSDGFLWFSKRDGYNHIYHYSTAGKLNRQVTSGEFDVHEFIGFDPTGRVAFVSAYHPVLERHIFKVNIRRGKMEQITNETGFHRGMMSSDGRYLHSIFSGEEIPGRNDLYSAEGVLLKTLHTAQNPLANKRIGQTEIISLNANDGTPLYGRLIKPSHFDPNKKYPVLVYVYGGPHVQLVNRTWLNGAGLWMHHLAEQGYIVFTLDNRGSGKRGLHFEQQTYQQLGTLEIQDQMNGISFLKKLDFVDTENMAVYGWSYGGFLAASLMLRTPGMFKAGVAGGAVTDWKNYEVMYTERYMGEPNENEAGYEMAALQEYAGNLRGKLLLLQGMSDEVVPISHSLQLMQKFVQSGIHADQFFYPTHGHNIRGTERVHLMEKVLGYIMEHTQPAASTIDNK